jgi:hypothetical protein
MIELLILIAYTSIAITVGELYSYMGKFNRLVLGHITILAIYAMYNSGLNSIAVFFIPIVILLYTNRKANNDVKLKFDKTHYFFVVLPLLLLCFFSKYPFLINVEYENLNIPTGDHVFYIKVAEYFTLTGNENPFTAKNILFNLTGNYPYRYHEMWFGSMFMKFSSLNSIRIFELIIWPFNYFFVSYSMYSFFIRDLRINIIFKILLSFLFIFFTISFTTNYGDPSYYFGVNGFPKLSINFVCLIACTRYYLDKNYNGLTLSLSILFILAPANFFVPIMMVGVMALKRQVHQIKYVLPFLFLLAIYFLINIQYLSNTFPSNHEYFPIFQYFKRYFGYPMLFPYLPYIVILLILGLIYRNYIRAEFKDYYMVLIELTVIGISSGYLTYAVFNFLLHDSFQLIGNIASVIVMICIYALVLNLIDKFNLRFRTTMLFLVFTYLGYCTFFIYSSQKFIISNSIKGHSKLFINNSIAKLSVKQINPIGVFIPSDSIGGSFEGYDSKQHSFFLCLAGRNFDVINLYSNLWKLGHYGSLEKKHKFNKYKFILNESQQAMNIYQNKVQFKSDSLTQFEFIKQYKISYALTKLNKNELPSYINGITKEVIHDSISNINLLLFN